ncbi:DNA-directed RNA polymerase subunit alpha [bacterium]|nr:DNA-directed RNA polymerase subunit alpha [bacterium]
MSYTGLQKPKKIEADPNTLTKTFGEFVIEPFERGFAVTIGNSLRRILLSGLEGAAVTSVKIEGALHEFTTIPGVVEDVTEIILNVKRLLLAMDGDVPRIIRIEKEGPCEVKASDIICESHVRVLNPEHHIADLDKDGKLRMEMEVKKGIGYVSSESNKSEDKEIGVIPIDSIFSPVIKANFRVEHTRLGQATDYEKLILQVWTDGSIEPADAISRSALILREYCSIFVNKDEDGHIEQEEEVSESAEETIPFNENLKKSIEELDLPLRATNCLKNADIRTLAELVQRNDDEIMQIKNFGRKSLNSLKGILMDMGLQLDMDLKKLSPEAQKVIEERNRAIRDEDYPDSGVEKE